MPFPRLKLISTLWPPPTRWTILSFAWWLAIQPGPLMLLGEAGVLALENEVLMIQSDNHPGTLAKIALRLSEAGVNIEYTYMAATINADKGLLILRPNDSR